MDRDKSPISNIEKVREEDDISMLNFLQEFTQLHANREDIYVVLELSKEGFVGQLKLSKCFY